MAESRRSSESTYSSGIGRELMTGSIVLGSDSTGAGSDWFTWREREGEGGG